MVIRLSRPPSQPGAVESSRTYTDYSQKDGTYRHVEVITGSMAVAMMARGGGGKTSNFRGLLCCLLMAAWLGLTESSGIKARKRELYIAGLFPFTGTHGSVGRGVKPAVDLALRHVNNDRSILPEYELKITFNDSKCDMAVATKAFFDLTYDNATTDAILFGDACYSVTGPMAEISREWGMFQLSYGDTDPLLSDRDKYPNFFRTVPSDSDYNPARLALLRHFNWSSVGTLFQDASQGGAARYGYAHNRFDSLMEKHTINVSKVESFADDPSTAIQNLRDHDIRIIVGNFAENMARKVFCSARQRGMYGPRHQWIILGDYSPDWWKITDSTVPCTPEMLNDTLDGYLATAVMPLSTDEELTEWGKTPEEYKRLYDLERGSEYSVYHGYAYDGIWVIAHALHRLLREEEMREGSNMAASLEELLRGARVGKALNDTNIRGVTSSIQQRRQSGCHQHPSDASGEDGEGGGIQYLHGAAGL
ncbi:gamma-aminobutyric acid type B receptor subunit 2-like isoform X2 [Pomacea canaliculata]|uniref:gamma-aminobutyric acid type B receptor subunit 2-like isoform X2 n=1 Tax=Pomacea canaliculata TaxID=400727 RepID=UPI000D725CA0|nr:gamma-aminobutyric acid type B receptor subunit 2-like isoform X2 [Pomacea canaliculata]